MKRYKLYLFDFDGTLLNTMSALEYVFTVGYEHVGLKFDPKDTVEFARIPLSEGYARMNGDPTKWQEFVDYIHAALDFPKAITSNEPYEESLEFMRYLKNNNIHAGIVTSNKTTHVKDVLNVFNIPLDTFDIYMGNQEYKRFKPHPEPILMAIEASKKDYKLSDVVYVGDGMNDTLCANNAGVDAVLIDRTGEFPDSDTYKRISNLNELFK